MKPKVKRYWTQFAKTGKPMSTALTLLTAAQ